MAVPSFELIKPESLDSQLTRQLLDYLLSGDLAPGERLPSERALAESLKVSRQAARNAVKSLAVLGIIETRGGSGSYLVSRQSDLLPRVIEWGILLSQSWATDLLDTRYQLEILLAGMAAERRTDDQLNLIREAYAEMDDAKDDYALYPEADAHFHLAVANASGNSILSGVLANIDLLLKAWSVRVITTAGETATSLPMHSAVLRAIECQDPVAARLAMDRHMERALRRLRESQPAS